MAARTLALVAAAVAALPTAAGDGRLGLVRAQATPRSCRGGRLGGRRAGVGRRRRQETRGGQRDAEGDSDAPDEGGGRISPETEALHSGAHAHVMTSACRASLAYILLRFPRVSS
ncbi:unnamed protein product [Prorocentrum cordatum]|uniref:Uncharacterized protein n=1 Tax=Prorocentrum cordatum TaxID=2364126 RepID=A0ABN9VTC2_9DINO|nr:unnamed protein product [Polarella glacialis]